MVLMPSLVVTSIALLLQQCHAQSTIDWLSDDDYNSLLTSFYNLDYNGDGMVTLNEAKLGILSILDAEYLAKQPTGENGEFAANVYANYHTFQPSRYNCVPSLVTMDFVDCLIMSVRHSTDTQEDALINFDHLLTLYFGDCDDVPPPSDPDAVCSTLVRESVDVCSSSSGSGSGSMYCTISCFQCTNDGRMLFEYKTDDVDDVVAADEPVITANTNGNANGLSWMPPQDLVHSVAIRMYSRSEKLALAGDHNSNMMEQRMKSNQLGRLHRDHVCPLKAKMKHLNLNRLVFMSDAHIEPWYAVDSDSYVARFASPSILNMFECRFADGSALQNAGAGAQCTLTGVSDPPISLFESALHAWNIYARRPEQSVLFFVGDAQAHKFTIDGYQEEAVETLATAMVDAMLFYFDADEIFIAAGNNDGPHNSLFTASNGGAGADTTALSDAWSRVLIDTRVVSNDVMPDKQYVIYGEAYNVEQLFLRTGYYMKPLNKIEHNYYVIVVNTNLGSLNPTQQMALVQDLRYVDSLEAGKVIVLGHHPSVLENMIPQEYLARTESMEAGVNDILLGMFSGHIHYFSPTDTRGFTTLPAMTQNAPYTAFAMADIQDHVVSADSDEGEAAISRKRIKVSNDNILMYIGADHQKIDSHCWH